MSYEFVLTAINFLTKLLTLPDVGASLMYSSIVATKEGGGCLL